jgi:hypothetical protein
MSTRAVILIATLWLLSVGLAVSGNHALAGFVALGSIVGLRMLRIAGPRINRSSEPSHPAPQAPSPQA